MLLRAATVVSFLLGAGCSVDASSESFGYLHVEGGGARIETAGIRIEIDGSIVLDSTLHGASNEESSSSTTLDGHPFGVRGGQFFVGESTYGAVRPGSVVRIRQRAVTVDDEPRGAMPASARTSSNR